MFVYQRVYVYSIFILSDIDIYLPANLPTYLSISWKLVIKNPIYPKGVSRHPM
jgi:hypothetical protein